MKNAKTLLVTSAALFGALSLSACATKNYVNTEVGRVDAFARNTQTELSTTNTKLAEVDGTAKDALERAIAAGKLAEGKFLYSMVLSDDGVKFPLASSELSPEAEGRLDQLVSQLKAENRNVYLEIQGHTDASGDPKYNEKLGEERAEAVRKFLAQHGVALSRMATISYGEEAPVAPNDNKDGRAQNRRVVVMVLA